MSGEPRCRPFFVENDRKRGLFGPTVVLPSVRPAADDDSPDRAAAFVSMPSCGLICYLDGMIRTQIQLTEEQARALRAQARLEDRSMVDLVRECVAEYLARRRTSDIRELARRARGLKGRFRSGSPDLAEAHDRYLDDAFDP